MRTISQYNRDQTFLYDLRESRLRKTALWIEKLPPGRLLDIGCSTGEWALYWQERGWEPYGVDINETHVQVAAGRGVRARVCDLNSEPIPYADALFDLVFAGEIIEHLVDTDGFIGELDRCLRPGGHLVITTPNLASFENRLRLLLGFYPIWLDHKLRGSGHVRGYTPAVLKRQLREHGFDVLRHTGNWVPFVPQRFADDVRFPWLAVTGSLLPSLAMDIMVLARKREAAVPVASLETP